MIECGQAPDQAHAIELESAADRYFRRFVCYVQHPHTGFIRFDTNAFVLRQIGGVGWFAELFEMGFVHTVEAWRDGELVGGLYGLALGGAFFGESMFHRAADASKVCLTYLVARLRRGGFSLLDAQFVTPHLESLGAIEIARADYRERLDAALGVHGDFRLLDPLANPDEVLRLALAGEA